MYKRNISNIIVEALSDTPVILINGARQTGKSTLCKALMEDKFKEKKSSTSLQDSEGWQFVTMDDTATLEAAKKDPMGFLQDMKKKFIIDEVQRVPEIFLPLKKLIDDDRKERRAILTGSANVMMLPKIGDSLAGRMEIHHLWPLSQDELIGKKSNFLHMFIEGERFESSKIVWADVAFKMIIGGYPEAIERDTSSRRHRWFSNYITALLQKDIRDLTNIEGLSEIPNILKFIATRVGSTINLSEISRLSNIKGSTLTRYMTILENIFMIVKVPAWTKNVEGQFVKSPKIYLIDTGLLNNLIGLEEDEGFLTKRHNVGAYLENFIVMEIIKQLSWSDELGLKPYHFSIHKGSEVDLILEDKRGGLYGIEIKSSATLNGKDFSGLRRFSEIAGDKFKRGIVLYTGEQYLGGFGNKLQAVPLTAVWTS